MFCKYCGHELLNDDKFCPFCGKKVNEEQENTEKQVLNTTSVNNDSFKKFEDYNQHVPYYVRQDNNPNEIEDSGSFGWAVLGFFVPLCGLILYLAWRSTKPKCAKNAGIGALVYVCIAGLFILLTIILSALAL